MLTELRLMINRWKQEAAGLSKTYLSKGLSDSEHGELLRLRLCIREAELLLPEKQLNREPSATIAANSMLGAVPCRKSQILNYLQTKTPDYKFTWAKDQKWVAVYETVLSLNRDLKIPKSSIYKALKELEGVEGFSFQQRLVSYEYRVG